MSTKIMLGIDPGAAGAITLITPYEIIKVIRFINTSYKKAFYILSDYQREDVLFKTWIEDVHAIPRDRKRINKLAIFMTNFGKSLMLAELFSVEINKVDPKKWQLHFGLGGKHGPEGCSPEVEYAFKKKAFHKKAQALYPDMKITKDMADSILIARYGLNQELDI